MATPGIPLLDQDDLAQKRDLESRHWWYRGRDRVLEAALRRASPLAGPVLDAGCGSGLRTRRLAQIGAVSAVDVNPAAVRAARELGCADAHEASLEALPFKPAAFRLVTCLDVLEHVEDDAAALTELRRVTTPGGALLLSVPAYPRLFGAHDVAAGHRRRYRLAGLRARAAAAGWRVRFATHFNTLLLPAVVVVRLAMRLRRGEREPRSDLLRTPAALDNILVWPLRAEAAAISRGVALPVGLSILVAFEAA